MTGRATLRLLAALPAIFPLACQAQKWSGTSSGIEYGSGGYVTLAAAIDTYADTHHASLSGKTIDVSDFFANNDWQQAELMAILKRDAPEKLDAALHSSGNYYSDPAINALIPPLKRALLKTTFVRNANIALARLGLTITDVDCEDYWFDKSGGQIRLEPYALLDIGPLKKTSPVK